MITRINNINVGRNTNFKQTTPKVDPAIIDGIKRRATLSCYTTQDTHILDQIVNATKNYINRFNSFMENFPKSIVLKDVEEAEYDNKGRLMDTLKFWEFFHTPTETTVRYKRNYSRPELDTTLEQINKEAVTKQILDKLMEIARINANSDDIKIREKSSAQYVKFVDTFAKETEQEKGYEQNFGPEIRKICEDKEYQLQVQSRQDYIAERNWHYAKKYLDETIRRYYLSGYNQLNSWQISAICDIAYSKIKEMCEDAAAKFDYIDIKAVEEVSKKVENIISELSKVMEKFPEYIKFDSFFDSKSKSIYLHFCSEDIIIDGIKIKDNFLDNCQKFIDKLQKTEYQTEVEKSFMKKMIDKLEQYCEREGLIDSQMLNRINELAQRTDSEGGLKENLEKRLNEIINNAKTKQEALRQKQIEKNQFEQMRQQYIQKIEDL